MKNLPVRKQCENDKNYFMILSFVILLFLCNNLKSSVNEQIIILPVDTLGAIVNELSYVMGVGDLDGDGELDFVVRLWSDENGLDNDIETR